MSRLRIADPARYVATRDALHAVAEQVLASARYDATGHIGLVPTPGGFGTPPFGRHHARDALRVDGVDFVIDHHGTEVAREPLTTLARAAAFAEVRLGPPPSYTPSTSVGPDAPLGIDRDDAAAVGAWLAFAAELLAGVVADAYPDDAAEEIVLWPEHFDLATALGPEPWRATVGVSLGDADHPLPYVYVSPWRQPPPGDARLWDAGRYARLGHDALVDESDPQSAAREWIDRLVLVVREG